MDHLESIGGDCEGPDFCRKFGDITIAEGIEKCRTEPGFHYAWAVWVFKKSPAETTNVSVRCELLKLITLPVDDCSIARAKHIYKSHRTLPRGEQKFLLKTIFRDDKNRYSDFTGAEVREGRRLNG